MTDRRRVGFLAEAHAEAEVAAAWYRRRDARVATRFVDELERALALLADNPHAGQRWTHAGTQGRVRRFPLPRFPFLLFYVVDESAVQVVAVAHSSRRPGYWIERLRRT